MAIPNSTLTSPKQLHIEAMQSITPGKVTEPGQSRRISVAAPLRHEALQSRLRIVLYYKKASDEESADAVAAWIKESLSMELEEHPVLAGRLRRDHESEGYWEIKFNDAGVRLVQATAETTMSEFLGSEGRDGREELLAYWVDIDRENPEVSALFYIQVTEFQGDGYSIGISCSLLLADPLFLSQFLNKWTLAHSQMLAQAYLPKTPIFHLGHFRKTKRPTHLKSTPLDSILSKPTTTTVLFKVPLAPGQRAPPYGALASLCIEEAAQRLEGMVVPEFFLITNDPMGDLKVEFCKKDGFALSGGVFDGALNVALSDELGLEELALSEGNKPVHVSYRVVSCGHEGLVVAMLPSDDEDVSGLLISATVPKKV